MTTRVGGKPAKSHVSPLAGRTISLVNGGCRRECQVSHQPKVPQLLSNCTLQIFYLIANPFTKANFTKSA
jgi:hypothetical protein